MTARAVPVAQRFWFLPSVMCGGAVLLAEALVLLDGRLDAPGRLGGLAYRVGVAGSRDLLGAVAGSVLTAAATTFSITIAVLALTSSSYGPRLVRNFMADRGNQAVLGVFLATFLYALLVLRSVRDESTIEGTPAFVPDLAVNVAVVLAVGDIAVLVYFIHHISDSIQVSTLSGRVRDELRSTIDHLYPEAGTDVAEAESEERAGRDADDVLPSGWRAAAVPVRSHADGFVARIDSRRLLQFAERHDLAVLLDVRPGDHVVRGDLLGRVWSTEGAGAIHDGSGDGVRAAVAVEDARTPQQDLRFGARQLMEIAVRALSPGINDPFTATNALDDLSASLSLLASRRSPSPVRLGEQGQVRLVAPGVSLDEVLRELFGLLRWYALDAPPVLHRAVALADAVGSRSATAATRQLLDAELSALAEGFRGREPHRADLEALDERVLAVRLHLAGPVADHAADHGGDPSGDGRGDRTGDRRDRPGAPSR